jgi:outer membrane protein TolC
MIPLVALALAATPVNLDDVRSRARGNTQALNLALEAIRAGQNVVLARSPLLPQVALGVSAGGTVASTSSQQSTVPVATGGFQTAYVNVPGYSFGTYSFTASLSQVLIDLGRWEQLKESHAALDVAKGQALEQADASELEGIRRFYALYSAQQSLVLLQQNVSRSQDQVTRAEGLYEAGRGQKGDVIAAQVNLGNDQIAVIKQGASIAQAQADLASWLVLPGDSDLVAVEPEEVRQAPPAPIALEAAMSTALEHRALLTQLRRQVDAVESAVAVAKDEYLPRLTGQAFYARNGPKVDPVFTDPSKQNVLSGSINLTWDAFTGLSTGAKIESARAQEREAEQNLSQAKTDIAASVRAAMIAVQAQESALTVATQNRSLAAQNLSVAEQRYQAGAGTTLDVRDAQLKLTQAELQLLQTRTDVEVARASLARAMGTLEDGAKS